MIINYFKIFAFLFFLNSFSQNIETIKVERDQKILSFINDFEISPNDFFILNPGYTNTRFNHSVAVGPSNLENYKIAWVHSSFP